MAPATYKDRGQGTLVGVVDDGPDVRDTCQNLRLRAESLALEDSPPISVTGCGANYTEPRICTASAAVLFGPRSTSDSPTSGLYIAPHT